MSVPHTLYTPPTQCQSTVFSLYFFSFIIIIIINLTIKKLCYQFVMNNSTHNNKTTHNTPLSLFLLLLLYFTVFYYMHTKFIKHVKQGGQI